MNNTHPDKHIVVIKVQAGFIHINASRITILFIVSPYTVVKPITLPFVYMYYNQIHINDKLLFNTNNLNIRHLSHLLIISGLLINF